MVETLVDFLLIILGFGALIFVHELGHFLAARWAGIRTEVFAVGMGTPVISWRKGVGFALGSTRKRLIARTGKEPHEMRREEFDRRGLGVTEYSLRWLPIGGFVKMLGQDDTDPGYVSDKPDSYNVCPVGKRMVVVSAGVVANVVLAVLLFVVAFMAGVRAQKSVVGGVAPSMPAATATALNAEALGVSEPGLRAGDAVTHIDGKKVSTFTDIRIAAAMARPEQVLTLRVERPGLTEPLQFRVSPQRGPDGLLSLGIAPASSTQLAGRDVLEELGVTLERIGLGACDVEPGMVLASAEGRPVETYEQFEAVARASGGRPVATEWSAPGGGFGARCDVAVEPVYQILPYAAAPPQSEQDFERGLLGLTPLVRITRVTEDSANYGLLRSGDVVLRAGAVDGPAMAVLRSELARRRSGEVELVVLRDGSPQTLRAAVDRDGMLNVSIDYAWDLPLIAEPMQRLAAMPGADERGVEPSPVAGLLLMPRSRLASVSGTEVSDWNSFRAALRRHTAGARDREAGATVDLTVVHPTPQQQRETLALALSREDVEALHGLEWRSRLGAYAFEPLYTTLSAGGNPLKAAVMGFEETHKTIVMTYLTIDRLLRGSVGVEQLRGPVGIVHIGTRIAGRGFMYVLFFLGIVSVNLAVINSLPIPIVDGGLFVFLLYEKFKGRPPSVAFQNAASLVGMAFIVTVFLVVTWNDLMRLVG